MATTYTVKQGDNLSSIARKHGLPSWQTIYNDPANASFRAKRPNPNLIFPGDVLVIPGVDPPGPTPPSPPTPPIPAPVPITPSATPQAIQAYLAREARRDVVTALIGHRADLTIFGEVHSTFDALKAFFLGEIIRRESLLKPLITHFHASERFRDDEPTRSRIHDFLQAGPLEAGRAMINLPGTVLPFAPTLGQARLFSNRRYGVLGIDPPQDPAKPHDEDLRHTGIFNSFRVSSQRGPDVPSGTINPGMSRGNMLLGARHAARRHVAGRSTATTCSQLIGAGWAVHSVRLTVPHRKSDAAVPEELNLRPLESSANE
ncbi:LysM peptidoglycan-binding domain-containing protein [Reyranella soli]|uniref:LysM peptidoglycan-binding domain-containing protein n=1 Tax=Reyranella soli TaxID=1230389 RepID=UPI001478C6FD|nr:LysM domain-containing protein [Reyranella soli]